MIMNIMGVAKMQIRSNVFIAIIIFRSYTSFAVIISQQSFNSEPDWVHNGTNTCLARYLA